MTAPDSPLVKDFALIASPEGVQATLADIRTFLCASDLCEGACGTVEIVLAEALNNVAEHAYGLTGAGDVLVKIALLDRTIRIHIVDNGAPMPGLQPPAGQPPALNGPFATLPEGGFGWFLIRSLTEGFSYTRAGGRNHLRLCLDRETSAKNMRS